MAESQQAITRCALPIEEARQVLGGLGRVALYRLINSGALRTFTVGRRRFVSEQAIREFIATREGRAAPAGDAA